MYKDIVEERKGMITIGMIYSGKTTFLNSIFGFNFLQTSDNITTKFICVIRYNPTIDEPIFYNLKLIPKNNNPNEYIYIKNGEQIKGKKDIKDKIKLINKSLNDCSELKYENLFWMLETNKVNIENKQFIENYDFYDIPGLNEYIKNNEKQININEDIEQNNILESTIDEDAPYPPINIDLNTKINDNQQKVNDISVNKEIDDDIYKHIKGIFKYLKGKIENFIFIISVESCYKPENLKIIEEIRKNIDFDFQGGLFILTKIDKAEKKDDTIFKCKEFFINNINSKIFNLHFNSFISLNSHFKNEIFMKEKIKYFFLYYYNKYYDEYVNISEDKRENSKNFITYIEFDILKQKIDEEDYDDFIEDAAREIKLKDLMKIKKIYEKINSDKNRKIEFGINFEDKDEDDESIIVLKGFYKLFKEKKYFPDFSENTKDILNYFNDYTHITFNNETKKKAKDKIDTYLEDLDNIFNEMKLYIDENKNDIIPLTKELNIKLENLKKYIKNGRNIYIPFIGISNAGKSTILNCLVGYKLFEVSDKECTRRGIIIEYGEEVELYEVKVQTINNYYIFEKDILVTKSIKKVQEYLKCLNCQYGNNEDTLFYIIKTPIKFFDDFNFNKELKTKIFLVDLPGCDTKDNKFNEHYNQTERTVYEKLLDISTSFVFINKGRAITNNENREILKNAYNVISDNSSLGQYYLDNCLFVINMFEKLNENDKKIPEIQKDFSTIIFNDLKSQQQNSKFINIELFNAKAYNDYLNEITNINNITNILNKLKIDFIQKKRKNFIKFCLSSIKTIFRESYMKNNIDEIVECDPSFYDNIKNKVMLIIEDLNLKYNESEDRDNLKKLSNIIQYMINNVRENKLYINSNCQNFFKMLESQIHKANDYTKKIFNNNLKDCFKFYDLIFDKDINSDNSKKNQSFKEKTKSILDNLEKLEGKYEIEKIFDKYFEKINELFIYIMDNKTNLIENYNKDVKKLITNELENKINNVISIELNNEIEESLKNLDNELSNYKNDLLTLFNIGLASELKKGKYKAEIDLIVNFSFYEKLKINICNLLGKDYQTVIAGIGLGTTFFGFVFLSFLIPGFNILEIIGGIIFGIVTSIIFLVIRGNKEKMLINKVNKAKNEIELNYFRMKTKFSRLYKSTIKETTNLFKDLLAIACSDLSKIEQKKWIELKGKYKEAKKNIISAEKKVNCL